ncbi:MAG: replication initiation factor [Betaproteobacteria bacterium HGW-Betaproteobacteria-1]|jgi:hypothetical protein|nr:MAG: replication initiation factor [Betaproteobacteria bacterium HGW-Betaproteobacteria-1]
MNSNKKGDSVSPDNINPSVDNEVFSSSAESGDVPAPSGNARSGGHSVGEAELDTSLTNRVSNKYNPDYFQPLRWGIDSLYVSFAGELHPDQELRLERLKKSAQSDQLREQALSQIELNQHIFEVKDKATGMFAFILEDNCFRIQLSRARAKSLPMAYVKISSEYLTHKSPDSIVDDLRQTLGFLGAVDYTPNISRIDLFVDFASSEEMESWGRHAWVSRSGDVDQYSVGGVFSGWAIGLGGAMVARLYDKLLEIVSSNKGYLVPLWNKAGWNGQHRVWGMEFQFNREILRQLGIKTYPDAVANLNGLWDYACTEWLRLTLPSETDQNRSRWPLHPLWGYISAIDFDTQGGSLSREFLAQRVPSDQRLFDHAFSVLTSFMAREKITDFYQGMEALNTALYHYLNNRAMNAGASFDDFVDERVAVKAKRYNSILNKAEADELDAAEAYRKLSDGE